MFHGVEDIADSGGVAMKIAQRSRVVPVPRQIHRHGPHSIDRELIDGPIPAPSAMPSAVHKQHGGRRVSDRPHLQESK
jgi:hypothetical protein